MILPPAHLARRARCDELPATVRWRVETPSATAPVWYPQDLQPKFPPPTAMPRATGDASPPRSPGDSGDSSPAPDSKSAQSDEKLPGLLDPQATAGRLVNRRAH